MIATPRHGRRRKRKLSLWWLLGLGLFVYWSFLRERSEPVSYDLLEVDSSESSPVADTDPIPEESISPKKLNDEPKAISHTRDDSAPASVEVKPYIIDQTDEAAVLVKPPSKSPTSVGAAASKPATKSVRNETAKQPKEDTAKPSEEETANKPSREQAIKPEPARPSSKAIPESSKETEKLSKETLNKRSTLNTPKEAVNNQKKGLFQRRNKPILKRFKNIRDQVAGKRVAKVNLRRFENDHRIKVKRPPLKSLISDDVEGIKKDVRYMMDFAILGHAKCATTFFSSWLREHPEVQTFDREVCDLYDLKPASLVKKLYEDLPPGDYQRGFKCPGHFSRRPMRYFRRYFSKTKLIVGIRHPIRWFESFYNFVSRHGDSLPEPNKCIGECTPEMRGVCTQNANFHGSLAIFGKTNMKDPTERRLLRLHNKYQFISPINNPVFLYHSDQLYDKNLTRFERMRTDFQHFMSLKRPMTNATKYESKRGIVKAKAINICDSKHALVREELLKIGTRASAWIRRYFLDSPEVFYSNRSYLESLIRKFETDPCLEESLLGA